MKFFRRTKNNISPFDHEKNFIQQDDEGDVLIYKNKIFDSKILISCTNLATTCYP